jgi:hypothetical protein
MMVLGEDLGFWVGFRFRGVGIRVLGEDLGFRV